MAGGVLNVDLSSELLCNVRAARARYQDHMESEKRKKKVTAAEEIKKRKLEELAELKSKRQRLETDAVALETEADKLAEQAERTSKLTFLAKSNALRKGAKSKRTEIAELDDIIISKQAIA